jgi:hypothetical protein
VSRILAVDPGPTESAYVVIGGESRRPVEFGKMDNQHFRQRLGFLGLTIDAGAIEMVASYGMAVGAEVFETCVWTGRFIEVSHETLTPIKRLAVKLHHCHTARANDSNIVRALVDRFAPGAPNFGKGTKADPGWFHGFSKDVWQAYALAVLVADRLDDVPHE